MPIGTNVKPLTAIGKFPNDIGKLFINKTLATSGKEITNAMIDEDDDDEDDEECIGTLLVIIG